MMYQTRKKSRKSQFKCQYDKYSDINYLKELNKAELKFLLLKRKDVDGVITQLIKEKSNKKVSS